MKQLKWSTLISFLTLLIGCGGENYGADADGGMNTDTGTDTEMDTDSDSDPGQEEDYVSNMSMEELPKVATILVLSWSQDVEVDSAWIEFTFENDEWIFHPNKAVPDIETEFATAIAKYVKARFK